MFVQMKEGGLKIRWSTVMGTVVMLQSTRVGVESVKALQSCFNVTFLLTSL